LASVVSLTIMRLLKSKFRNFTSGVDCRRQKIQLDL